jgi:D-glycero-D-manno-heptose 1,7-bisphosphate phosphatase
MDPAIFLDRDGVIIENVESYVRNLEDVKIFSSSLDALRKLASSPYKIIIITNQSAVGRGIISLQQANEINKKVISTIKDTGGRVDGLFMCPHSPQDRCDCRKPLPGLILQAAEALSLDLNRSIVIGDALSDIQAGQAAGIPHNILVKTGRGSVQLQLPLAASMPKFLIFEDLESVIDNILSDHFQY